ncbi:MAG: tRNA (5-methylaminomethyl-2-thiouridylate)-methyltransferase [Candidatus Cloacimonas sp.]
MTAKLYFLLDKKELFSGIGNMKTHKAIALFSGGLDSILAVKWMQNRGYLIHPIFFKAPYLFPERALDFASQNNIELEIYDISEEHIELLKNPIYGFGKRMNPCIDCHSLMFKKAAELLPSRNADYIISGEVLGQRPKSQRRDALNSVSKLSGIKDFIIRPLSQNLLPDTLPIREGWIDKKDMLSIHGRGRYAQMDLAKQLGVVNYPSPAGGCLLTDRNYCLRLADLQKYCQDDLHSIELLAKGRHFRLHKDAKLIIGRDDAENEWLKNIFQNGIMLEAEEYNGPTGFITGNVDADTLKLALDIFILYYPKVQNNATINVWTVQDKKIVAKTTEIATKGNREIINKYLISYT